MTENQLKLRLEPPYLIGADEIGAYAGVHPETAAAAMRAGELVAHQFSKHGTWRARPADVEAWVEGRATDVQRRRGRSSR